MVNKIPVPPGQMAGTAVVRDKYGNVKGEISFRLNPDSKEQEKVSGDSNADKRGA